MFIIYGAGSNSKTWTIANEKEEGVVDVIVAKYMYFSLLFLPISFAYDWYIGSVKEGDELPNMKQIAYKDLQEKYGEKTPKISIIRRFLLLWVFLALVAYISVLVALGV